MVFSKSTPAAPPTPPPSPRQEQEPAALAIRGNYAPMRAFFFAFRKLAHDKALDYGGMSRAEVDLLNRVKVLPSWSIVEAHSLYQLLGRWAREMKRWGYDYHQLVPPQTTTSTRVAPTQPAAVRQQAVTLGDGCFLLYLLPTSPLVPMVRELLPTKSWDGRLGQWRVAYTDAQALSDFANAHQIIVGDSAGRMLETCLLNLEQSYGAKRIELSLPLKKELFDFQTVGVDFGIRMRRVLIADQMGLGKTPQGIGTATGWNQWPILVICPKSLRGNWKREIEDWTDYRAQIATPKVVRHLPALIAAGKCDFLITNFEGLKTHFVNTILAGRDGGPPIVVFNGRERLFKGVIVDEAHECKNPKTDRFRILKALADPMQYRCLLTGTPFVNRIEDLMSLVELLGHLPTFGGRKGFLKQYGNINAREFQKGQGATLGQLNEQLRRVCMIRREKHQVLTQLPDKTRTIVPLEIDNRRDYDLAQMNLQQYLLQNNASSQHISRAMQAEMLTRMMLLKQLSCRGKVRQAAEYVQNILDQGQKVILFVWHRETITALRKHWPDLLEISGATKDEVVDANKELFQNNPHHKLIVITYKRGGVGHTLTAASNVVFLELGWNPKDQDQAEDRAHRIGQKSSVNCHYLLGKDTIDEWIYDIIRKKRHIGRESVGSTEDITTNVQGALARKFLEMKDAA